MQESMEYTDGEEKKEQVEVPKSIYLPGESEEFGKMRIELLAQAEKYLQGYDSYDVALTSKKVKGLEVR